MKTLVCFGDSITARHEGFTEPMLTSKIAERLPTINVINAGVPGHNTNDALSRIEQDVLSHQPHFVTVLFGANDAGKKRPVDLSTFTENMRTIVRFIGPYKTILITPSPVDEQKQADRTNNLLGQYAQAVKNVALELNCHLIDFYRHFLSQSDYQTKLKGIEDDGLHFGEAGYELLSELIVEKWQQLQT